MDELKSALIEDVGKATTRLPYLGSFIGTKMWRGMGETSVACGGRYAGSRLG